MTGTTRSSADLPVAHKRLLFHAWHRGTREMDLLLGRFVDASVADFTSQDVEEMESLLQVPDVELYRWITEQATIPHNHRSAMLSRVIEYHKGVRWT